MISWRRFLNGGLQPPFLTFLVGLGTLSIFYSLIIVHIIGPAYRIQNAERVGRSIQSLAVVDKHGNGNKVSQEEHKSGKDPPLPANHTHNTSKIEYASAEMIDAAEREEQIKMEALLKITDFDRTLRILNDSGGPWRDFKYFTSRVENVTFITGEIPQEVVKRMANEKEKLDTWIAKSKPKPEDADRRVKIYIGMIICGQRRHEAGIMLKSLVMFSQDALVHLIIFSDKSTILDVGQDLLALKWLVQRKLGFDLSFELHLEQFPKDTGTDWRSMYRLCATQRLFFPGLLPHIDSLIYLDTDIIVASNMTEFWQHFTVHMKKDHMVAVAANNEDSANGWYGEWVRIPYVGKRGLNAGVMMMNLTRLRDFKFQERSVASNVVFREKIKLADQDIINIIFSGFPEYVYPLNCSYNFNWVHCGAQSYICTNDKGTNVCFCQAALGDGIRVIHGNSGTFHGNFRETLFLSQLYQAFNMFEFLTDSALTMFEHLKTKYDELPYKPCKPLTSDILYRNALKYLRNMETAPVGLLQNEKTEPRKKS